MNLRECFDKRGSDKGFRHGYESFYEPRFAPKRHEPLRILEIGVLSGASLAAWLDYFPNAQVIGVDTFKRVPASSVPILSHPRVTWWGLDSTEFVPLIDEVDVVIDDGSHKPEAQLATLALYRRLLKSGGSYFIEDVKDTRAFTYVTAFRGNAGEYLIEVQ